MDRFFAEHPNNSISWLNDLGKERYGTTATALLAEAEKSNNLEVSHVRHYRAFESLIDNPCLQLMLSVGKLSYLEQTFDNEPAEDGILDGTRPHFASGQVLIDVAKHSTMALTSLVSTRPFFKG
jgi:nuclear pore complex protein Nup133